MLPLALVPTVLGLHASAVRTPAAPVHARASVRLVAEAPERERAGKNGDLIPEEPTLKDWIDNMPFAMSKSLARTILLSETKEPEPLPGIWDWFWDAMPFLAAGKKGEPLGLGDVARTFKTNIEQIFGNIPAPDKAPLAAADVEGLDFQAIFLALKTYFDRYGSVYKMCFGPKSFMVVNDPVIARHILRENPDNYDKGALSLVLEDIMGKGLIPADYETWKNRRRAIAPGFHKLYLQRMVSEFGQANANLIPQLLAAAQEGRIVELDRLIREEGISPDVADYDGRTALHLAACEGNMDLVKMLIDEYGAKRSTVDRWGNTPLDEATRHLTERGCVVFEAEPCDDHVSIPDRASTAHCVTFAKASNVIS